MRHESSVTNHELLMQPLAEPVTQLIDAFCKLPGIGPKTATRFIYYIANDNHALNLANTLETLKRRAPSSAANATTLPTATPARSAIIHSATTA